MHFGSSLLEWHITNLIRAITPTVNHKMVIVFVIEELCMEDFSFSTNFISVNS